MFEREHRSRSARRSTNLCARRSRIHSQFFAALRGRLYTLGFATGKIVVGRRAECSRTRALSRISSTSLADARAWRLVVMVPTGTSQTDSFLLIIGARKARIKSLIGGG